MDEPQMHFAKGKKPDQKGCTLFPSIQYSGKAKLQGQKIDQ